MREADAMQVKQVRHKHTLLLFTSIMLLMHLNTSVIFFYTVVGAEQISQIITQPYMEVKGVRERAEPQTGEIT